MSRNGDPEEYSPKLDKHSKTSSGTADDEELSQVNEVDGDLKPGNLLHVDHKPRLLLMGLKRSGKSSISNVVFRKMAPHETLFLETTTTIRKEAMQ
ncbi:MAG: hypothetical protein Q9175_006384 [Cornicularia normoerica]